ncbi:MAG: tRNA (adenosine(37)-N6)-threonylcarbamoyltransferase complex dimerization subunit type 1 TsaB [Chloroflexota bacterium]|nr:tRNA (adenosine(37)-N6)-threonylcarbamoyltransferase complex dimerization subunit type 1 TsaB [Chloroflexota bacterium]
MTLLAIDTATQRVSLALHDGEQVIAEHTWLCPNQHTRQIPPLIRQMLTEAGLTAAALTGVTVASGPGAYTSLRMGIALAKGIADGHRLPLIGVSTFDIAASTVAGGSGIGALIVTLLAGRARVSVARYQWRKNSWKPRAEPENMSWEALLASIDGAATLTGEIDSMGHEQIAAARADGLALTVLPASVRLRRAGALAEIAWARLIASRESDDETSDTDPADAAGQERRAAFESSRLAPVYITSKDSPL